MATLAAIDQYGGEAATEANRRLAYLASELAALPPPEGMVLYKITAISKPGEALSAREYLGPAQYESVRAHYDPILRRQGFVFIRELPSLASPYACYQRGDEKASVELPGDAGSLGPTLLVSLSWGLSRC